MRFEAKVFTRGIALFVGLVGVLVLLGWGVDRPVLKGLRPGYATMTFNTAVALVAAGLSLSTAAGSRS
ncbi:MAG: hypothetical protein K2P78_00410 [Gemmataceae bacterium]|nr:hypothetical protein [Gemmataceae bacterium]